MLLGFQVAYQFNDFLPKDYWLLGDCVKLITRNLGNLVNAARWTRRSRSRYSCSSKDIRIMIAKLKFGRVPAELAVRVWNYAMRFTKSIYVEWLRGTLVVMVSSESLCQSHKNFNPAVCFANELCPRSYI